MAHNKPKAKLASSKEDEKGEHTTRTDDIPDGGFRAWVQVASTFCIYLNTWSACPIPICRIEDLELTVS